MVNNNRYTKLKEVVLQLLLSNKNQNQGNINKKQLSVQNFILWLSNCTSYRSSSSCNSCCISRSICLVLGCNATHGRPGCLRRGGEDVFRDRPSVEVGRPLHLYFPLAATHSRTFRALVLQSGNYSKSLKYNYHSSTLTFHLKHNALNFLFDSFKRT